MYKNAIPTHATQSHQEAVEPGLRTLADRPTAMQNKIPAIESAMVRLASLINTLTAHVDQARKVFGPVMRREVDKPPMPVMPPRDISVPLAADLLDLSDKLEMINDNLNEILDRTEL